MDRVNKRTLVIIITGLLGRWDWNRRNWWNTRNSVFQLIEQSIASLSCFCISTFFVVKKDALSSIFVIAEVPFTSTFGILGVMHKLTKFAFCIV